MKKMYVLLLLSLAFAQSGIVSPMRHDVAEIMNRMTGQDKSVEAVSNGDGVIPRPCITDATALSEEGVRTCDVGINTGPMEIRLGEEDRRLLLEAKESSDRACELASIAQLTGVRMIQNIEHQKVILENVTEAYKRVVSSLGRGLKVDSELTSLRVQNKRLKKVFCALEERVREMLKKGEINPVEIEGLASAHDLIENISMSVKDRLQLVKSSCRSHWEAFDEGFVLVTGYEPDFIDYARHAQEVSGGLASLMGQFGIDEERIGEMILVIHGKDFLVTHNEALRDGMLDVIGRLPVEIDAWLCGELLLIEDGYDPACMTKERIDLVGDVYIDEEQ